jgi:hypothetical protein
MHTHKNEIKRKLHDVKSSVDFVIMLITCPLSSFEYLASSSSHRRSIIGRGTENELMSTFTGFNTISFVK